MKLPIPKGLQRRLAPLVERGNQFLRTWEWTWTTAVVACVTIAFAALIFLAVIPSFWLYYAQNTLRCSLNEIAIASALPKLRP